MVCLTRNGWGWWGQRGREWCWGGWRIWLTGVLGPGSWDDLFHEVGVFSTGKLLSLLPLGIVVIQRWRQHSVWKKPTAGEHRQTEMLVMQGH